MTIARKRQVHPDTTPYYHVVSRCVRRAFLCGVDDRTGSDFQHRRQWIVERIELLTQVFAIDIVAYAIMSNHLHLVVRLAPLRSSQWSNDEVVDRWSKVYGVPALIRAAAKADASAAEVQAAGELIEVRRQRLSSLSWFMKCLNEHIARRANAEDDCTGAFWEGRFKSQALLDERALLSCMTYVDLNPIRAGMAQTSEASRYTSVRQRIRNTPTLPLVPFQDETTQIEDALPMNLTDYLDLVDGTGRIFIQGKHGAIPDKLPAILDRIGFDERTWMKSMRLYRNAEIRALGPLEALRRFAQQLSRHWFRGSNDCRAVFGSGSS